MGNQQSNKKPSKPPVAEKNAQPATSQPNISVLSVCQANLFRFNGHLLLGLNKKVKNQLPILTLADRTVTVDKLATYLKEEKSNRSCHRLLFIPCLVEDYWVSVALYIHADNQLASVACIDSRSTELTSLKYSLKESIQSAYPDFQLPVNQYPGHVRQNSDKDSSATLAIENSISLLNRAYFGMRFELNETIYSKKSVLQLQRLQQSQQEQYAEYIQPFFIMMLQALLQNIKLDIVDIVSLMLVSRTAYHTVMTSPSINALIDTSDPWQLASWQLASSTHSFLLTLTGVLYSCGDNDYGQQGYTSQESRKQWTKIDLPKEVKKAKVQHVVAGYKHSFFLTDQGELYACGHNLYGQLGLGDYQYGKEWTKIHLPEKAKVLCVAAGLNYSLLLTNQDELYGCGENQCGQLGLDGNQNRKQWEKINLPEEVKVQRVVAGGFHSFVVSKTDELYACGSNFYGQLGIGDTQDRDAWTKVDLSNIHLYSLIGQPYNAIRSYLHDVKKDPSAAFDTLIDSLSVEQLQLVLYKVKNEQAEKLNLQAYKKMTEINKSQPPQSSSDLRLFPETPENTYDSTVNYLVLYKKALGEQQKPASYACN